MWQLELAMGPPRLDRPAVIYLKDGLTVGRGNAMVLLDGEKGGGMGRVHASFTIDGEGPVLHSHSVNKCRVENRAGGH